LELHNRSVRRRALESNASSQPAKSITAVAPSNAAPRSRDRRPSCSARVRGSRRGPSQRRGGDSGDDSGGGEPEPEPGPLEQTVRAVGS
jgi:hypothetical protein